MKIANLPEPRRTKRPLRKANHSPFAEPVVALASQEALPDVVELICTVQHYGWGDRRFIPELLGDKNDAGFPYAELWMGAHPDAPSTVVLRAGVISLGDLIRTAPERILHRSVAARYEGQLPFLFKILAAGSPLSVQAHPSLLSARAGFDRENQAQVPMNARTRNYRDANHKPELIVALTDFYALRGFRDPLEIRRDLMAAPELRALAEGFTAQPESLRVLYSQFMSLRQEEVDRLLGPWVGRLAAAQRSQPFQKSDWEYWLLRAHESYSQGEHYDRGLLSFMLLNLVQLQPGQGLFLPAGLLHSYLEGAGVELMANSNNVLRGGLTSKHVDVPELLRNIVFDGQPAAILQAQRQGRTPEWVYATPACEFELSRLELDGSEPFLRTGDHAVEIMIVLPPAGGTVTVKTARGRRVFRRGQVFLIAANTTYELRASGPVTLFKATVPLAPSPTENLVDTAKGLTFRGGQPPALAFGTSGLRGLVTDITDLEAYINTRGFLDYALASGDAAPNQLVCVGGDLRPSTDSPDRSIVRAVARAIVDSGLRVEWLGRLPTPALTFYALQQRRLSIMVTGSHIPFDRNGIKFNLSTGEVSKSDEAAILQFVKRVRLTEYARPAAESAFADDGMFKARPDATLPAVNEEACQAYLHRYLDFFPSKPLAGQRVVFYQHSAVGRDLLPDLLRSLGAEVIPMGRSESFVPVDTEAISDDKLDLLQRLVDEARRHHGRVDAILSTDGDSDRPLLAGITGDGQIRFFGGDLLGLVAAEFLAADAVVVPISANDAVDRWAAVRRVAVIKTKIGSPYVIQGMQQARGAARIVGWEANGGFLTASDITRNGRTLAPLPTRDAVLPLLAALCAANERCRPLTELFAALPRRCGKAGLLDQFPVESSRALLDRFMPKQARGKDVTLAETNNPVPDRGSEPEPALSPAPSELEQIRRELERFFRPLDGFAGVARINTLDGLRIFFQNGDIAHVRPSGNAPQLRIYAVADTQARADEIVALALREPDGILRRMEAAVAAPVLESEFAASVRRNIALTAELFARGETPELIGTVSGSRSAQTFWQNVLNQTRESFKAAAAVSFVEDLPTNQAFGLLLLWQRLKPHLRGDRGALAAFVFGDGTRSTPFTETDGAQKPAMATFVPAGPTTGTRFLSMVELALRYFVPVQQFLRRSGFEGLVVKWGDEVQIPTHDLSGTDPLFNQADIVRFVSLREMTADEAKNKDWVGVEESGRITAFIPRRPLEQMEALAGRGLLQRRGGRLWGGVNLGSIAVSTVLLDCLLEEFSPEVNDPSAKREDRPALDPEFFTALTIAAIEDCRACAEAWARAITESGDTRVLDGRFPDLIHRLRRVLRNLEARQGRKLKMVAMDFGDQYWGDIGQHAKIREFFMALNQDSPTGEVARAMAGLPGQRNAQGNFIVNSIVSSEVRVSHSVLINVSLSGRGVVEQSVLVGTRAGNVDIRDAFDVLSAAAELQIRPGGGAYKVVAGNPVQVGTGERLTTLFLSTLGPQVFRVREETDLKDKARNYSVPILGNPLSFHQAHVEMGSLVMEVLEQRRREAEANVPGLVRVLRS